MEFNEIVVKESPGLCRCCLSEGCYKDLGTEYTWMNETEVYADMLLECFDISITQHNDGPNGPNRLICEVCITRLRDACNFKKQVMDSEKKFIDMMGRGEFRPKMLIYQTQMKCEDQAVEQIENANVEYLEDEIEFGDDDLLKDSESVEASVSDITVTALPIKGKRGRPRKATPLKPEKRAKVAKADDKPKTSKAVSKDVFGLSPVSNLRRLISIILEYSTIMPFKWYLNRYRCFYCDHTFVHSSELKQHSRNHIDIKLKDYLLKIGTTSRIKWDVSEISCKLCPKPISNYDDFLHHINKCHDVNIDTEIFYRNSYFFNLSDDAMSCLECDEKFKFFAPLLRHVNKYHNKSKKYICDHCGLAFALKGTIKHHLRNKHSSTPTSCNICGENFTTKISLTVHCRKEHKTGKFACDLCSETFESRYARKNHIAILHNVKSMQYPCEICSKIFTTRSILMKHVSGTHLKEKFATCHICGFKGFDLNGLKRHLATHDREIYKCHICHRKFFKNKNYLAHMDKHSKGQINIIPWDKQKPIKSQIL